MTDTQMQVLALMQWMGECPAPWQINSEVGTLAGDAPPGGKMFRFLRYDVRLEKDWLARELNYQVSDDLLEQPARDGRSEIVHRALRDWRPGRGEAGENRAPRGLKARQIA